MRPAGSSGTALLALRLQRASMPSWQGLCAATGAAQLLWTGCSLPRWGPLLSSGWQVELCVCWVAVPLQRLDLVNTVNLGAMTLYSCQAPFTVQPEGSKDKLDDLHIFWLQPAPL